MIVLVRSAPDSQEAWRAVKLARDMAADLVLMQNAVYMAEHDRLEGYCGTVYIVDEDRRLRGIDAGEIEPKVKRIGYGELVDIMADTDKVIGIF